MKERERRTKR
jgi:hypothetical protein